MLMKGTLQWKKYAELLIGVSEKDYAIIGEHHLGKLLTFLKPFPFVKNIILLNL